jgi:predicted transport protein
MKPETRELYDRVDKAIAELDSRIQPAKINKEFIGYRTTGNYFCTVKPTAKALNIQVKCKGGSPQPSGLEVMELPRDRWGPMTHTFKISEKRQVEPALQVISLALKDSV